LRTPKYEVLDKTPNKTMLWNFNISVN